MLENLFISFVPIKVKKKINKRNMQFLTTATVTATASEKEEQKTTMTAATYQFM